MFKVNRSKLVEADQYTSASGIHATTLYVDELPDPYDKFWKKKLKELNLSPIRDTKGSVWMSDNTLHMYHLLRADGQSSYGILFKALDGSHKNDWLTWDEVVDIETNKRESVEPDKMHKLLDIPSDEKIIDHYKSGEALANALLAKVDKAEAMKMVTYAGNFIKGTDVFDKAREYLSKKESVYPNEMTVGMHVYLTEPMTLEDTEGNEHYLKGAWGFTIINKDTYSVTLDDGEHKYIVDTTDEFCQKLRTDSNRSIWDL